MPDLNNVLLPIFDNKLIPKPIRPYQTYRPFYLQRIRPLLLAKIKYKKCYKCKQIKLLIEFSKQNNTKFGVSSMCKECRKEYNKQYRLKHTPHPPLTL
jgi:hypothetical protein